MDDPYEILGVQRTASADEIRKAYRGLAKRWHPDTNPDKPEAEARFKAISAAYALLSDTDQRARFDRGEIDASGTERGPPPPPPPRGGTGGGWRDWAETDQGARYRSSGGGFGGDFDESDLEDFLSRAFGRRGSQGPARGADLRFSLQIPFLDAARGASRTVSLPDGRGLRVEIPKGAETGTTLRLQGQGMPGVGEGAPPGDALVVLDVQPHRFFRREGNDILLDLPLTLKEAVLGARVEVPTVEGPVTLTVPPRSAEGTRLRLRGRGVNGGHQYVVLRPVLPDEPEPELEEFLRGWTPRSASDPRAGMLAP